MVRLQYIFVCFCYLQIQSLVYGGAILSLLLLFFFYLPLNMLLAYLLSFGFNKYDTAQSVMPTIFVLVSKPVRGI